ncbi:hypothetical protein F3Y22_tig00112281pilonHSYRG00018 [Hibiscus syriacus]|uniref:Uncharacterized protein n=1 Tax=Hibiscus syriacus TaxID=106335 RepID=A0A6A2X257_HIBSY|nr:hypothetical protein F3Y22_tig00112281pilonHSYRG00018 [Hibiscus syriacus]
MTVSCISGLQLCLGGGNPIIPIVTLKLNDGPYSRAMWDFGFQARYKASITDVSMKGLKGCKTLNKDPDLKNLIEGREERDAVTFPGFVDCIYLDAPTEVHLDNGLVGRMLFCGTHICRWKHVTKILSVLKMQRLGPGFQITVRKRDRALEIVVSSQSELPVTPAIALATAAITPATTTITINSK